MALKKDIYDNLQYRIITNDLRAGQQLYEKKLMTEYGIGRTPLREVFQELQRNGLVQILPKLGTSVVNMDLAMLRDIVRVRRVLEGLAGELAAINIRQDEIEKLRYLIDKGASINNNGGDGLLRLTKYDTEIHLTIYEATRNLQLKEIVERLLYKMSMYWYQVGFTPEDFHIEFDDLEALLKAFEQRRTEDAKDIMEKHIDHYLKLIKNTLF